MTKDLIIIDIETTGLNELKDQILEIAAVKVTPNFQETVLLNTLVCPDNWENPEEWWPVKQGLITKEELKSSPSPQEVATEFVSVIDTYWTSYNVEFELKFLKKEPWFLKKPTWKCLMKASHEFMKPTPEEAEIMRMELPHIDPYKYPSAQEMSEEIAYEMTGYSYYPEQAHRALEDVKQEIEILKYLISKNAYDFPP